MDLNQDGVVTLDEFLDCCRNDDAISRSMAVFDSSFWHDARVPDDRPSALSATFDATKKHSPGDINCNSISGNYCQSQHQKKVNLSSRNRSRKHGGQPGRGNLHANRYNFNEQFTLHHECEVYSRRSDHSTASRPSWPDHELRSRRFAHHGLYRSNGMPLQTLSAPPSPSLVKVKAWYTVAKQGVC